MLYSRPWLRQPPSGTQGRNRSNRLLVNWRRGISRADVLGTELLAVGGASLAPTPQALGLRLASASTQYVYATQSVLGASVLGTQAFTIAVYALPGNATTRGALLAFGSSASGTPYVWLEVNQANDGKLSFNTRTDASADEIITTTNTYTAGQAITAVAVQSSAVARKVVLNGVLASSGIGTRDYSTQTWTLDRTAIGALVRNNVITPFEGSISFAVVQARAWSDAEIKEFSRNPWQHFASPGRRMWSPQTINSVALSGNEASGAVGSLTPSIEIALTGVVASGSVGGVAASTTVALAGVQGAGEVGGVTVQSSNITIALTGVSAGGQVGGLSPVGGDVADTGGGGFVQRFTPIRPPIQPRKIAALERPIEPKEEEEQGPVPVSRLAALLLAKAPDAPTRLVEQTPAPSLDRVFAAQEEQREEVRANALLAEQEELARKAAEAAIKKAMDNRRRKAILLAIALADE